MNKYSVYSLLGAVLATTTIQAQNLEEAKKAIQDEKFDKAKDILHALVKSNPDDGSNFYYLGDLFLKENQSDSSRFYFNKGLEAKNKGSLNYIGLGQLELDNNREAEARTNFAKAEKDFKKKDYAEQLLIANAYTNSDHPNTKEAIKIAKSVIEKDYKNAQAYLVLGKAYLQDKNMNEAFSAFRNAYDYDNTMLEAKLQLAAITKRARAYGNAVNDFKEVLGLNPNYAPAYRELAETYYLWAKNSNSNQDEYIRNASENYKKYIEMSDGSSDSKMQYADFLVQTENYVELEKIANELKDNENINPRIFRYLGYAAFKNGNYQESVSALDSFLKKYLKTNKSINIIGRDYFYLGLSKMALADKSGSRDEALYQEGLQSLREAVKVEEAIAGEFNAYGVASFKKANLEGYNDAVDVLKISAVVKNQPNYVYDNYYLGYSYYFIGKETEDDATYKLASDAFSNTIAVSPTTEEAYLLKARVNRYIDSVESRELMNEAYLGFIKALTDKGELGSAKHKNTVIEAYTFIGAHYATINDNAKAVEYLNKVLAIDASNEYAKNTIKSIKG